MEQTRGLSLWLSQALGGGSMGGEEGESMGSLGGDMGEQGEKHRETWGSMGRA